MELRPAFCRRLVDVGFDLRRVDDHRPRDDLRRVVDRCRAGGVRNELLELVLVFLAVDVASDVHRVVVDHLRRHLVEATLGQRLRQGGLPRVHRQLDRTLHVLEPRDTARGIERDGFLRRIVDGAAQRRDEIGADGDRHVLEAARRERIGELLFEFIGTRMHDQWLVGHALDIRVLTNEREELVLLHLAGDTAADARDPVLGNVDRDAHRNPDRGPQR